MKLKFISLSPHETKVHQTIDLFCCLIVIEISKVCTLNYLIKKLPSYLIVQFIIHLNYQSRQYRGGVEVSIICYTIFTNRYLRRMDAA